MSPRWQGGVATAIFTALTITLVILEATVRSLRRFWDTHALTADTVAGLMVLALTVLVVNQIIGRRQVAERSRVVAAQAGFLLGQARRCAQAVGSLQKGEGGRDSAVDEARTYSFMLMVAAPVLIDSSVSREFLEQAQRLGAEFARTLYPSEYRLSVSGRADGLDEAINRLRTAAKPLVDVLTASERSLVEGDSG